MRIILSCLLFLPGFAAGMGLEEAIREAANSKMSIMTNINEQDASVVYVGKAASCESVSIIWTRQRIENFRVCNGEVSPRNTVSPAWDSSASRTVYSSVVNNAISYGQAKQKDINGYLISARSLNAVSHNCKNIEVIVSYDDDLVDRDVHEVCGRH